LGQWLRNIEIGKVVAAMKVVSMCVYDLCVEKCFGDLSFSNM